MAEEWWEPVRGRAHGARAMARHGWCGLTKLNPAHRLVGGVG